MARRPDLFPVLRVLADRRPLPARFLLLGSASPDLLRQGSESLAGRVEIIEMGGFDLSEVGASAVERLWLRGGFPPSFLARTQEASTTWRENFIRTFLERDLSQLGLGVPPLTLRRFWTSRSRPSPGSSPALGLRRLARPPESAGHLRAERPRRPSRGLGRPLALP